MISSRTWSDEANQTHLAIQERHETYEKAKDLAKIKGVLEKIASGQEIEPRYRDHVLIGQYRGTRECHIEPDWLLIYEKAESEVVLIRTGTHSDLFK
jgi:mRNA interferase YafQ